MAENLYRRSGVYWARFYVPLDQQARLGRKEFAWSLGTRDPKTARTKLAAKRLEFEALVAAPDPHRVDLESRYGIPASLPAAEALRRLAGYGRRGGRCPPLGCVAR